jgi:hypothetical protein
MPACKPGVAELGEPADIFRKLRWYGRNALNDEIVSGFEDGGGVGRLRLRERGKAQRRR